MLCLVLISPALLAKESEKKTKESKIEFIEGVPERPFIKISPIYAPANSFLMSNAIDSCMKLARKQAKKAGADAIIEFKVATQQSSVASGFTGGFGATSQEIPVITGWAVKWEGAEKK